MKIFSLYQDFFKFLDEIGSQAELWKTYLSYYYRPHKKFLESYFSNFPLLDFSSLRQRVESIQVGHYSRLKNLISVCPPEEIIEEACEKCIGIFSPAKEPDVYLFIGFFSPDGFVMDFQGKPVICFGLERFKDFSLFKILFAHEYAHFLLNLSRGEIPEGKRLKWLIVSEGIAVCFSSLVFPQNKLSDHFLFGRDRLNWCQENESLLREIYFSSQFSSIELIDFYFKGNPELNIPPRAARYLGYQAVRRYLSQGKEKAISLLYANKKTALSLEL